MLVPFGHKPGTVPRSQPCCRSPAARSSAQTDPCSLMPMDVSISQELTSGLCPAWKSLRGAGAGGAPAHWMLPV